MNSVISSGSRVRWFVLEHRTAGCPPHAGTGDTEQCRWQRPCWLNPLSGAASLPQDPCLICHRHPKLLIQAGMPHSGKIQPKDTNILVMSLQYQLWPSTENCCMGFFPKDGNWVFLDHQACDGGRVFGGLRRCCQWACKTHKISD